MGFPRQKSKHGSLSQSYAIVVCLLLYGSIHIVLLESGYQALAHKKNTVIVILDTLFSVAVDGKCVMHRVW